MKLSTALLFIGGALAPAQTAPLHGASIPSPPPAAVAVPRATFIATMDSEFRKMDADHNAILTRKEIEDNQRALAAIAIDNRRRAVFAALDADHNGMLTAAEFGRLELPAPPIAAAPVLAQNDLNRDGKVTLVEYRTGKLANFDRMDADKDGVVSITEMRSAGLIK